MHFQKTSLFFVYLLGMLVATGGCGGPGSQGATGLDRETRVAMRILATHYRGYLMSHRNKPPKDINDFRKYLESRSEESKLPNAEGLDQSLRSPRDGQPYTIVCGKLLSPTDDPGIFWAAYEQEGVDGKRMAVRTYGGVDLLDAEQFAKEFQ